MAEDMLFANPGRRSFSGLIGAAKTVDDLRSIARRRLPGFVYEYLEGGADSEITLARNVTVLNRHLWLPRMSIDVGAVNTSATVFGRSLAMPLVIAPTGFNGMLWQCGDLALARAAAKAGVAFSQSTVSMDSIEDIAAVPAGRHWFQLYAYEGPRVVDRLVKRALNAECEALVVTIDGATSGNRVWDQRSYGSPGRLTFKRKAEALRHPRWLWQVMLKNGVPNFRNLEEFIEGSDRSVFAVGRWIASNRPILTWNDISRLRRAWPRKLIIKGILRIDEARRALDAGADAIVVSNHGGRQAEPTVATIEVLPEIRKRLGEEVTILVDGGFRTGSHIAIALALGANAVLTGRATLYGLAAGGQAGAGKALFILQSELQRTMALIGATSLSDLVPDLIRERAS